VGAGELVLRECWRGRRASLAGVLAGGGGGRGKGGGDGDGGSGGGWGGGEGGAASWGGGAFDAGCVNAFLTAASRVSCVLLGPSLLLLLLLCCVLPLLVDLSQVMWGPSRHLGSLTTANWVSFDFNASYSSY